MEARSNSWPVDRGDQKEDVHPPGNGPGSGSECLVLSALGCGSIGNPSHHIAHLFKEVLEEYEGIFSRVHSGMFDDENARKSNAKVAPFEREMGVQQRLVRFDYEHM